MKYPANALQKQLMYPGGREASGGLLNQYIHKNWEPTDSVSRLNFLFFLSQLVVTCASFTVKSHDSQGTFGAIVRKTGIPKSTGQASSPQSEISKMGVPDGPMVVSILSYGLMTWMIWGLWLRKPSKKLASWTGIITPIPDTSNGISAAGHWNEETEEGENSPQQTIFVVLGSMQTIWGIKVDPRRRPDTIFLDTPSIYL